jgi:hypothetical protein
VTLSQLAFHQLVARGLMKNFLSPVETTEDCIRFIINVDSFATDVVMAGFEPEPNYQAIRVSFWFSHTDGKRMNFAGIPYDDLLFMCHVLSGSVEWGAISPLQFDQDNIHVNLSACLDTDTEDIESMNKLDTESRLLRGLLRLIKEVEMLYPALYGVASGQIKDISNLQLFLSEKEETEN